MRGVAGEIGGYIEFEHFGGAEYHQHALALNCGRCCLSYLVKARNISSIWIPTFLCDSVVRTLEADSVSVFEYPVTHNLLPDYNRLNITENDYLYLVDYYGQLTEHDIDTACKHCNGRLIVDEAQGFFNKPLPNIDTLYTCRKYFGVPDGAYLYTNAHLDCIPPQDESHERMGFLFGRFERPSSEFYADYVANNKLFAREPIKAMSPITHNILRGIDYAEVIKCRERNFSMLDRLLGNSNNLSLRSPVGPFMYPLLVNNGALIRKQLQERKVFTPLLWPYALDKDPVAQNYALNILPLPVDQRYDENDMIYVAETVLSLL